MGHSLALVPEEKWGLLERTPPGEDFKGRAALGDSRIWAGTSEWMQMPKRRLGCSTDGQEAGGPGGSWAAHLGRVLPWAGCRGGTRPQARWRMGFPGRWGWRGGWRGVEPQCGGGTAAECGPRCPVRGGLGAGLPHSTHTEVKPFQSTRPGKQSRDEEL